MNSSANKVNSFSGDQLDGMLDQLDAMMLKMGRIMSSGAGGPLASLGVNPPQYMLLRALANHGPSCVSEIAEFLGVGSPAASMLIKSLESKGLVDRSADPNDRRITRIGVSAEGREITERGEVARRAAFTRYVGGFDVAEMETFMRVLTKFIDAVATDTA